MNKRLLVFLFVLALIISPSIMVFAEDEASSTPLVDPVIIDPVTPPADPATTTDPVLPPSDPATTTDPEISGGSPMLMMGPMIIPPLPPPSPTATLDVYTIDNIIIAPEDTFGVLATTSSIDLDFSGAVTASLNILDSNSVLVKNIYNWASVTHPTPKIWYGKDEFDNFVPDGTYTVQVVYSDAGGNATDTSKTIIVDNDVPIVGAITITPSFVVGGTTYISTSSELSVSVSDEGTGVRDCNFGYDNGTVNYWPDIIVPSVGNCVLSGVDTSDLTLTKIIVQAYDNFLHSQSADQAVTVDGTAPVLTLLGNSTINLTVGETYTEAGATALDDVFGDITASIIISGTVNTSIIGTYTLTYNVTDSLGNVATPVTRTVIVSSVYSTGGHSGGFAPGWGPNGPIGGGRVLGTSTTALINPIELAKYNKLKQLKKKLNGLRGRIYELKHPGFAAVVADGEGAGTLTVTATPLVEASDTAATSTDQTATTTAKKPFWKFW